MLVFIRSSAAAAPGDALRRKYAASRRMNRSSDAALGARSSSQLLPPQSRSICSMLRSRSSAVGAHG
jgi:hypothetical protein